MSLKESSSEYQSFEEGSAQSYNHCARTYRLTEEGYENYIIYRLDGQEYQMNQDGKVFIEDFDEETGRCRLVKIKDKAIVSRIRKMAEDDQAVSGARNRFSEVLSQGDPLLQKVMRIHLEYRRGHADSEPMEKEGIKFYSVGHNASHFFYLGVKDGKMYYCSIDGWYGSCDYYDALDAGELDEEDIGNDGSSVHEVDPDNLGYIGHF